MLQAEAVGLLFVAGVRRETDHGADRSVLSPCSQLYKITNTGSVLLNQ